MHEGCSTLSGVQNTNYFVRMICIAYLKPVRGTGDGGRGSSGDETPAYIVICFVTMSGAEWQSQIRH